ncbi:MAG: Rossmann-like and DUF2520 domain-containing protein [Myxococcota bacterium]|nr:Rossmann-like and DUF2520 domain-containing protein [Myxococcota bacterium]
MGIDSIALIGASNAGLAFALAARRRGIVVRGIWNRGAVGRERATALLPGVRVAGLDAPIASDAALTLVAVADSAIADIAKRVTHVAGTLAHLSGALPASVLGRENAAGIHPMLSIANPTIGADALTGAIVTVEGAPEPSEHAGLFVRRLGGRPVPIAAADKARYHAAAVFASNFVVATMASAADLVGRGLAEGLMGLARSALDNVAKNGPADALTGPVLRGDVVTVEKHLAALVNSQDRALYRAASLKALDLALSRGLPKDKAEALAKALGA